MATKVLQRLLTINMACAKEAPTQGSKRHRADPKRATRPRRTGIRLATASKQLAELGHVINPKRGNNTLACQRCLCNRPLREAPAWALAGQCPGPPTASTGPQGLPRPPPSAGVHVSGFGRGRVHPSHRTTLIKGLLFCWGCGGYAAARVKALATPCGPLTDTGQRLARVRQGLPPKPHMQWPEP